MASNQGIEIDSKAFAASLNKYQKNVNQQLQAAIEDCALLTERDSKKNCPVDTGRLRASITSSIGKLEAEVGSNVEYAIFVEYGTSNQSAQPFLRPALDNALPKLQKNIAKALGGK